MRRSSQAELLDGDVSGPELSENLADLARLNRLSGTTGALCRVVSRLLQTDSVADRVRTVLDVGTGGADLAPLLNRQAKVNGLAVRFIAADLHSDVLRCSRQSESARPPVNYVSGFVQLDGTRLPFADCSIDAATCSQTIHHLAPEQVVMLLSELARVSRIGFVLLDLERSWPANLAIRLLTYLISQNRLTRHDGPLSVRRAYRGAEIAELAARAGLKLKLRPVFPFRWLAAWERA